MTLTPTSLRADAFIGNKKLNCGPGSKPCGNACIPKDNKCRASWNKPVKLAAGTAAVVGAGLVGTALFHPRANMRRAAGEMFEPLTQAGFGAANVAGGNWPGAAKNFANAALSGRNFGKNARTVAQGYGTDIRNTVNSARNAYFKWKNHRPASSQAASSGFNWEQWRANAPKAGSTEAQRRSWAEEFYRNTPGAKRRRDSIWATGFAP